MRNEIKNMRENRSTEDRMRKSNICLIGISEEQNRGRRSNNLVSANFLPN